MRAFLSWEVHTINSIELLTNLQQNWAGHLTCPRLTFFCFWNPTELQGSWMVNRSLIKCTCTAPRVFISPLVSSRQSQQICVVCRSETILDTWIQEMGGRGQNGGNSLLFSVFGTRTVVFQIAIPRNLLKTSSSSYHVSYSVQSISLCKK